MALENELAIFREYVNTVGDGIKEIRKDLAGLSERLTRIEERQIPLFSVRDDLNKLEKKVDALSQDDKNNIKRSTLSEKIVGALIGIGITILTAYLTAHLVK